MQLEVAVAGTGSCRLYQFDNLEDDNKLITKQIKHMLKHCKGSYFNNSKKLQTIGLTTYTQEGEQCWAGRSVRSLDNLVQQNSHPISLRTVLHC